MDDPSVSIEYRCKTCDKEYHNKYGAIKCYRNHDITEAIERVVTMGDIYE